MTALFPPPRRAYNVAMDPENDDDLKQPMIPLGDLGTILIAAVFLLGFLYLMFGPNPFEAMVKSGGPAAQRPQNEVSVTLPQKR